MAAIVLKYVQLLCVAFFAKTSNCSSMMSKSEEVNNFKIAACIAECLYSQTNYTTERCYEHCSNTTETLTNINVSHALQQNGSEFGLYCRDSRKLMIKVNNENKISSENHIYMLVVQESTGKFIDRLVYFSDEQLIEVTVDDLSTNESTTLSYNVSAYIVSSNASIQTLGMRKFTTLMESYMPEDIIDIDLVQWIDKVDNITGEAYLNMQIEWLPARDRTCSYDVVYFGSHLDINQKEVPLKSLYNFTITERLKYDEEYLVGVRGKNSHKEHLQSEVKWVPFHSKSCKSSDCVIIKIESLSVEYTHLGNRSFNVNALWKTNIQPERIFIKLRDSDHNYHQNTTETFELNSTQSSFIFENIVIIGTSFSVNLTVSLDNNTDVNIAYVSLPLYPDDKLDEILFYSLVGIMVLLLIVLFKVWKGRIDSFISIMAQKRLENMDLETVKTMSMGTVLESIAELTKDELMEVERENITILELLGEGAFGLVNKALMIRNGEKQYVAVKMLKNTSNLEDIKQFHQEITVMKSVGQHANIVSIVGHSTSDLKYLMLLTEYCDSGNLLDTLRHEFAKQLNFYDKKSRPRVSLQKYHDSLLNFDMTESDKKEISYKNIVGCSTAASRLFVVNQMYDELNNNASNGDGGGGERALKVIEMTATNALYLELNEGTAEAMTAIEIPEKNDFHDFLTSSNLISFAKQIADGMDFLARKKVVHRDLAARNILVCGNKVVKISDFGLSRDIYQDNVYRKTGNGKLPIKWLALESMTHQVYTSQSDVWSFGILLYEIVTLGALPYSSISVENLLKVLRSGYRMERPYHCHILLYELMTLCWQANPLDRPSFDVLAGKLQHFLTTHEESWGERIIDLQRMFDKCTSEMNYMKPLA